MKSRGFRYFIGVLTSHGGSVRFYKKAATGDSIFRENTTHYIEADYVEMPSRRLSELVKEHNLKMPDFIKIDVQGAEIEVMNGGLEAIQHAKAILLECPVTQYNIGAPVFDDYLKFMDKIGYFPSMLVEDHQIGGQLVQVDILFLRRGSQS